MRRCVVFDLDGTLTKSEEGIFNCVRYACEKMAVPTPDDSTLRRFVGPPLRYSFQQWLGMDAQQAERAVQAFRERYSTVGLFENRVYPGIRRLLRMLHRRGDWVAVATGKLEDPARRILDHFGLSPWIDRVVGTAPGGGADKAELIRSAMPADWGEAWMVGDRSYDIQGGKAAGIHTVGVGYGYGSEQELRESGCERYAADVEALIQLLCPGEAAPAGAFLSIEGLDGSGKSTQIALLTDSLDRYGFEVIHSREPGGSPIGEKIREIILDNANAEMTAETEALLYAASRAQHVRQVIRPAVRDGKVLLCDRYIDSSVAYQGGGRQLGTDHVLQINEHAVDGMWPLCTVYLDISHTEALARRYGASSPDRLESENDSFFARVEEAYRAMIAAAPERYVVVDATQSPEVIGRAASIGVLQRLMEAERNG